MTTSSTRRLRMPKARLLSLGIAVAVFGQLSLSAREQTLSLAGRWRFQLDRADAGLSERWFERTLPDTVKLPGGLTEQGIGDPVSVDTKWIGSIVDKSWFTAPEYAKYRQPGNIKVPFWLQPDRYYAGPAWFQRVFEVPKEWTNRRVVLFLERPHWETRVWVDSRFFGTNNALATPHEYDLGQLAPGKHTLTVRVDNRLVIDVGENSHSVSDHTQGNWNGIVGKIELRSTPLLWIEEVRVDPDLHGKRLRVRTTAGNSFGQTLQADLRFGLDIRGIPSLPPFPQTTLDDTQVQPGLSSVETDIPLGDMVFPWDEFKPQLYGLWVRLEKSDDRTVFDTCDVTIGLREIATQGTRLTINGRPMFVRGTLECCIFPKTGHPPTDVDSWKRIIRIAKAHGLNLLRFHSWCPPEAAFVAADELGFYFHIECSSWANQSTTIGDGKPVDRWIYEEADRILKYYGNHPSFLLMPYGNEPGGRNANAFLAKWVEHYRAQDPRRLYTAGSGWPQIEQNQFHVTPDPRIQGWGEGLKSRINARPPETTTDYRDYINNRSVPVISHEIGQWCVYPNFAEISKYTGYLKPKNFEIFRDRLAAGGMEKLAKRFLLASGHLQALCYKEDIESALRTPGMGGFELLDLHDFPGQGTALVGVLGPFWEEKGYITAREYSRFCNQTVPLARLSKRVFTTGENLKADLEVAHFGPAPLTNAIVTWELKNSRGEVMTNGGWTVKSIDLGNALPLGSLDLSLTSAPAPAQYKLVVRVGAASFASVPRRSDPSVFENDWDLWVYPAPAAPLGSADVLVTARFDAEAQARLRAGGNVLLTIPGDQVRNFDQAPVKLGFSSIFWNTAWTQRQAPTTLGILCDPTHPALAPFPTESHSNWQWWYLVHRAGALRLDLLPPGVEPVVRIIDDWVTARPLGLVVEGRVGPGRIVICGFDLTRNAGDPVSRQIRASLARYLGAKETRSLREFTPEQIKALSTTPMAWNRFADPGFATR